MGQKDGLIDVFDEFTHRHPDFLTKADTTAAALTSTVSALGGHNGRILELTKWLMAQLKDGTPEELLRKVIADFPESMELNQTLDQLVKHYSAAQKV
jgi:hypothetical protein